MNEASANNEPHSDLVHLHLHSEYSLLDGAIRISDAIKKVKSQGHKALALTDHANMFGAVEFYSKCKDAGIKPLIGVEIYWQGCPATRELSNQLSQESKLNQAYHLVLLAKDIEGYRNLCRIVSYGYLRSCSSDLPVVSFEDVKANTANLIALSSCLQGEVGQLLTTWKLINPELSIADFKAPSHPDEVLIKEALDQHVGTLKSWFPEGDYYVELIDNGLSQQKQLLPLMADIAKSYGLPLVATSDSHYLNEEDAEAHAVLTAVKNDLTISALRERNLKASFHLKNDEQIRSLYAQWPEAIENQRHIADKCNLELEFGKYFLPSFHVEGYENSDDALRALSEKGLEERLVVLREQYAPDFDEKKEEVYWQRLKYETDVIISMGFPGYFLIVQDFINWAKDHDIPVGPGRGSGAGSLVAYALRITDLDPLRFNLIFERFLNPERVSMPDFDVDFCQDRRDEVIQYVTRKYGSDNVAQITTFGKMKAKAALRDVGRVLELSYTRVDKIAKLIPNELDITLQSALEREPKINEEAKRDDNVASMIRLALKLEGMSRHTSVHAAGVVISEGGMENYVPVHKDENGTLITQYEMKNAEKVGLVKFDFLGLKTLTVIHKAVELIRASKDKNFDIETIPLEEKKVYELVSQAHSVGVFQLESSGMQALLHKLKPSRFEDIIAVVALYRPGPLGSGMVDDFIERKHGRQQITYLHPELETILDDTYGIILYQEQVQKIAAALASYSLGEADLLRRAMGKKKPEEMEKQKARFISGCEKNEVAPEVAEELFELMAKFAAYGFNKSHSAAYGLVSYQTAYLKAFYPEEFMAAIMTCDLDNTDKIVRYIEECKRMNFKIYPPDVNRSSLEFDVPHNKAVGFGLAAIKGVGQQVLEPIISERQSNGSYRSLTDFAKRVNLARVGKKTLELLVQAGALDCFSTNRPAMLKLIAELVKLSDSHHQAKQSGQMLLFAEEESFEEDSVCEFEERLRIPEIDYSPMDWLLRERKILGVFLSGHPCLLYQADFKKFSGIKLKDLEQHVKKKNLPVVALLNGVSERLTKTNKKIAFVTLEDETHMFEAIMGAEDEYPASNSLVVAYLSINPAFDGSGFNIRVESLKTLTQVRSELIKSAYVEVVVKDDDALQHKAIQSLKALVCQHPGQTDLNFRLKFADAKLDISNQKHKIDLNDEFFESMISLSDHGIQVSYS